MHDFFIDYFLDYLCSLSKFLKMLNYLIFPFIIFHFDKSLTPEQECENEIYSGCNHKSQFTDEGIDNARKCVRQRFAKTNSKKLLCSKFHVRKNIKCLTESERKN